MPAATEEKPMDDAPVETTQATWWDLGALAADLGALAQFRAAHAELTGDPPPAAAPAVPPTPYRIISTALSSTFSFSETQCACSPPCEVGCCVCKEHLRADLPPIEEDMRLQCPTIRYSIPRSVFDADIDLRHRRERLYKGRTDLDSLAIFNHCGHPPELPAMAAAGRRWR
jgi:hypothetical protein